MRTWRTQRQCWCLAHAASEPSEAASLDETRWQEPLRSAALKAAEISEPLSAAP